MIRKVDDQQPSWTSRPQFEGPLDSQSIFGSTQPVATEWVFAAGDLSITFCNGAIGSITHRNCVVLEGLQAVTRDNVWSRLEQTCLPPELEDSPDGTVITMRGTTRLDEARFRSELVTTIRSATRIEVNLTGEWTTPVEVNRQGLLLLHPATCAGLAAGRIGNALKDDRETLPLLPAPHQPFRHLTDFWHDLPDGGRIAFQMNGPLFEMEDQRNWLDASFKTYCPPLGPPLPYKLNAGPIMAQSIQIEITPSQSAAPPPRSRSDMSVRISDTAGTLPRLGETLAKDHKTKRRLPDLALTTDLDAEDMMKRLRQAAAVSDAVTLNVILPGADIDEELKKLKDMCADTSLNVRRLTLLPRPGGKYGQSHQSYCHVAGTAFPNAQVGTGSIAHFIDLHRHPQRLASADFGAYALCPTVHDPGDLAVLKTLSTLPAFFAKAARVLGPRTHVISHAGLSLLYRPTGKPTGAQPDNRNVTSNGDDPRDRAALGLAWAIGLLGQAGRAGVSQIFYSDGLSDQLSPFADMSEAEYWPLDVAHDASVTGFKWRAQSGPHQLALANIGSAKIRFGLEDKLFGSRGIELAPCETIVLQA